MVEVNLESLLGNHSWILYIIGGIFLTLSYAAVSLFFGLILGSLITIVNFVSQNRFVKFLLALYVSFFRGTPLLVQIVLCYWGLPSLTGISISPFVAGILVFSLNSAAYVSEIIRSGISAIDAGQFEAGQALNLSKFQIIIKIILPQAIKNMIPSLINEMVDLIKESSIISIIGQADIMKRAQNVAAQTNEYMAPLLVAAACYYVLVSFFSHFARKIGAQK